MIRKLASEYEIALSDSFEAFDRYNKNNGDFLELMSWVNHLNRKGHETGNYLIKTLRKLKISHKFTTVLAGLLMIAIGISQVM